MKKGRATMIMVMMIQIHGTIYNRFGELHRKMCLLTMCHSQYVSECMGSVHQGERCPRFTTAHLHLSSM